VIVDQSSRNAPRPPTRETPLNLSGLLALLLDFQWIHRRIEGISFVDELRVQRRISLDFSVSDAMPKAPGDPNSVLVPIAILRKEKLRKFDLRDSDGNALAVLTAEQNGRLTGALLVALYGAACRRSDPAFAPDPDVERDLRDLATANPDTAKHIRRRLEGTEPGHPAHHIHAIATRSVLRTLIVDFESHFMLVAVVPGSSGQRRIVKYSHEQPLSRFITGNWAQRLWLRVRALLSTAEQRITLLASGIGAAQSYHIEVEMPEDLIAKSATLRKLGGTQDPLDQDENVLRVHLRAENQPRDMQARVDLIFLLRPSVLWPYVIISAGTTLVLAVAAALRIWMFHPQADPLTSLLVAFPGFFVVYALATGHRLTRRLSLTLRLSSLASAVLSFLAAASLALIAPPQAPSWWRLWTWITLAVLSGANTLGLVASLSPSRRSENAVNL
jgi:hypothetical protein